MQGSFRLQWIYQDGVKASKNIDKVTFIPFYDTLSNFHDKVSKLPMLNDKKEIPELSGEGSCWGRIIVGGGGGNHCRSYNSDASFNKTYYFF